MSEFIINENNRQAYEVFCNLHPVEAYYLNKQMFCDYCRKKTQSTISDQQIEILIKETENERTQQ